MISRAPSSASARAVRGDARERGGRGGTRRATRARAERREASVAARALGGRDARVERRLVRARERVVAGRGWTRRVERATTATPRATAGDDEDDARAARSGEGEAEEDAESGESGGNDVEDAREAPAVAAREPSEDSEDEETTEEVEQREREEESERQAVSRRVFGTESNTQAMTVTRSLLMFAAFCVALAAWPKIIGLLCSYFEPLDTAVTAFEALTSNVGLDLGIMRATSTATFKVVALCVLITGLMREGKLPLDTPVVVSKLAFNVMLPAYLCTRVAATLYLSPLTKALAVLPLSAMAQVIFGSMIGVVVTSFVNKIFAYASSHEEKKELDEAEEVRAIKEKNDMSRLGIAACSFGNTFTLPLVFLTEVLGRARADETAGYIALYLIGWTPVLWTVGFLLIAGPVAVAGLSKDGEKDALRDAFLTTRATMGRIGKELLNPPLLGIIAGVLIGATPLKEVFIGNFSSATAEFSGVVTFVFVILRALFELAASVGAAALPGQMLVLASSLVKITPEDVEKRIARAKKAKETKVPVDEEEYEETAKGNVAQAALDVFVGACALIARTFGSIRSGFAYLFRLNVPDAKALTAACIVRFIALPAACLFGLLFLRALNSPWFPSDRSAALVLLTMSCMPAAQNLVLLTQLREATRPLAPRLAALMLRQYVFAIIPVTFWLTAFTDAVV